MLLLIFAGYYSSRACSPIPTPASTSTAVVGGSLVISVTGSSPYLGCSYYIELELVCNNQPMPGVAPFFYTSPAQVYNTNPQIFPTYSISLNSLCAGGTYQFRFRQTNSPGIFSPWTPVYTLVMPGVPVPVSLSVTATPPAICFPQTSQLTSTVSGGCGGGGGTSYTWVPSTGLSCVNCPSPVASPSTTTTYTLLVSGTGPGSCWSASTSITITSFTVPGAVGTATAIPTRCQGQTNNVSISSSAGALQWEQSLNGGPYTDVAGQTGTTMITPTLAPGTYCYRLRAVGCGGTVTSAPVCSTVYPNPTVTVNSASICAGQVVSLNGVGAPQITWPPGITVTGPTSGTVSPPVTTAYTATGTANGCSATAAFNITVQPYPVVNIGSNSPICKGNPLTLSNTGIGTYMWNGPNGFTANVQNPVIPVANPSNTGVYNVLVSQNGCATGASVNVIVLSPTVSATNNGTYCAGNTIQLNSFSSPVISYNWAGPAFTSSLQTPTLTAQVASTGIYTVTVNDGTCSATATTAVLVHANPIPTLSSNAPICASNSLAINVSGGNTYTISGPLNFYSNNANNLINSASAGASGIYTVIAEDLNGCIGTITSNILINPLPPLQLYGDAACVGGTAAIIAMGTGVYSWAGPNGFTSIQQNLYFPSLDETEVGDYTVTLTGSNGCSIVGITTLSLHPIPTPTAFCTPSVCLGQKVSFEGSGGMLYMWQGPNGFISHEANPEIESANTLNYSGTYTLGVTDSKGCVGMSTTNLFVKALPTASIIASTNNLCVPYCATYSIVSSSQLQKVDWNMNNLGFNEGEVYNYCITTSGGKTLRTVYTDDYGCMNTSTFAVHAHPLPVADFHYGPGGPVEGDLVEFVDASLGPAISKWEWYFADNGKNAFYQNPSFTFEKAGAYPVTLIVANKWGCIDTITKAVLVGLDANLYVPNVFTPDGDGVNDVFQPKGYGITSYRLQIFNRWGELIFESNDFATGWDGTVKGKVIKDESYVWKITAGDVKGRNKEYTGHVSILKNK